MKRAFFIFITAFFAILFVIKPLQVFAQETVVKTDTPVGIDASASQSSEFVSNNLNYELPYPGMLPDNPLYVFKVIRDGIVKFLISDPVNKAKFSLLNADKRMYAGLMLVENSKSKLAIETIDKSNNYYTDALSAIATAKKKTPKSMDIQPLLQQIRISTLKHQELIGEIRQTIDKQYLPQLLSEENRIKDVQKNVENLLRQK